jgi:hypothetical protein
LPKKANKQTSYEEIGPISTSSRCLLPPTTYLSNLGNKKVDYDIIQTPKVHPNALIYPSLSKDKSKKYNSCPSCPILNNVEIEEPPSYH